MSVVAGMRNRTFYYIWRAECDCIVSFNTINLQAIRINLIYRAASLVSFPLQSVKIKIWVTGRKPAVLMTFNFIAGTEPSHCVNVFQGPYSTGKTRRFPLRDRSSSSKFFTPWEYSVMVWSCSSTLKIELSTVSILALFTGGLGFKARPETDYPDYLLGTHNSMISFHVLYNC